MFVNNAQLQFIRFTTLSILSIKLIFINEDS